jgi:pimeloyl-ACP methyl ester carboxylesterase
MVDDCSINYVSWGDSAKPGLVLLHGSNAHLEWWRPIAPLLADQFYVVAMDSSGSGNSGWRRQYSRSQFASEIMGVAKAAGISDKFFVVGHSFGAFNTLEAGYCFGEELAGIVMVDFAIQTEATAAEFMKMREALREKPQWPTRVYDDYQQAVGRFRLVPEQSCKNPFLIDYIAEQSLREVEGGWTWKFDPAMFRNLDKGVTQTLTQTQKLQAVACPAAFIMAETSSDYSREAAQYTQQLVAGKKPFYSIPGTFHHLMFDEPLALAMSIKSLLLGWHNRS